MIDHALSYARRGWAVFPCAGKLPLTKHGFKDAVKDPEAVKALFAPHKGCNIGISTGKVSGIFVLDIDVKNGQPGEQSLAALEDQYGKLPDTVEAHTQNGGRHLYFKYAPGVGCKTGFRPGLDVRSCGGYVIAPPSTGYVWEASSGPDTTTIAEAPEWLVSLLKEAPATAPVQAQDSEKFAAGTRNDALTREAGKLRTHGLGPEALLAALRDVNARKCDPPLPDAEVVTIANSIAKRPERGKARDPRDAITELWAARYMYERVGHELHYVKQLGGWHVWQDGVWQSDETMKIYRMAIETIKAIREEGEKTNSMTKVKFSISYETNARRKAVIDTLATLDGIAEHYNKFDKNLKLFNCANCILLEE